MAFPPAHMLVACGCAELARVALPVPRARAWLLAAVLSVTPDLDFLVGFLAGNVHEYHGTFTHSLFAMAVVGLLVGVGAGWRWGVVGLVGYGSHLLVDLLDDRGRTNVLLGWPFTHAQSEALARLFPTVPFEFDRGVLVSLSDPAVHHQLGVQTLIGAAGLVATLLLAGLLRRFLPAAPR